MTDTKQVTSIHSLLEAGTVKAPPSQLDQEGKEKLALDGTPFVVTDIEYGAGENGAFWQVKAEYTDGTPFQFRLSSHEGRDTFISNLQAVLGKTAVSGLRLRAANPEAKNKFIVFDIAETDPFEQGA